MEEGRRLCCIVCVCVCGGCGGGLGLHVLQIRLLVGSPCAGSSQGDKGVGVSAWLQTAAPWGLTDPGANGGRKTAG